MGKFIDLTGMRFGRLTVLKRSPDTRKKGEMDLPMRMWEYHSCGYFSAKKRSHAILRMLTKRKNKFGLP